MKEEFVIKNKVGLHARPASLFVQVAKKFGSEITVEKDGNRVNAKSILGVLSLGVEQGEKITIEAIGDDEKEAMEEFRRLIENNFGEEE